MRLQRLLAAALIPAVVIAATGCANSSPPAAVAATTTKSTTTTTAAAAAVGLVIADETTVLAFRVRGGKLLAGPGQVTIPLHHSVTITVDTDIADELHVHGYEKEAPLTPGVDGKLTFTADLPGVFDVELHQSDQLLCRLTVQPG